MIVFFMVEDSPHNLSSPLAQGNIFARIAQVIPIRHLTICTKIFSSPRSLVRIFKPKSLLEQLEACRFKC